MSNEGMTNTRTNNRAIRSGVEQHDTIVEPRTRLEQSNSEEIFLSPRVLDSSAFARFADMLKSIIAQASAQGRVLEDFSADAEAMIKRCNDAGETVNKRLQAGIRMLKMIDERAERTDQLLEKVQRALPDAQAMSERIDRVIDERLAASEAKIESIISQAEGRAAAAERRAYEAIERTQEHAGEMETLGHSIEERLTSLRDAITESQQERSEGEDRISRLVDDACAQITQIIDQATARASEANETMDTRANEVLGEIETRVSRVGESIEPLMEASSKAMRALGMDPEQPVFEDSPLARIESLVDRGETQLASLDRVYRQLEDLQSQAESVRSAFGNWLVTAATELDTLEARKDHVVGPMQDAAKTIMKLGPDLDQKLELASTELSQLQFEQKTLRETIAASSTLAGEVTDRLSNQSGQLQALLDGSLHKLSTRVEQAGVWLGTLIQRAEALGAALPNAGSMGFDPTQPAGMNPVTQSPPSHTHTYQSAGNGTAAQTPTNNGTHANVPQGFAAPQTAESAPMTNSTEEQAAQDLPAAFDQAVLDEIEEIKSYVTPRPPQLPIDAMSFEGSGQVYRHDESDEQAS